MWASDPTPAGTQVRDPWEYGFGPLPSSQLKYQALSVTGFGP